jgi:hypothetical protein
MIRTRLLSSPRELLRAEGRARPGLDSEFGPPALSPGAAKAQDASGDESHGEKKAPPQACGAKVSVDRWGEGYRGYRPSPDIGSAENGATMVLAACAYRP